MQPYINAAAIVVNTIVTTTINMIMEDTILRVFLLFILNIFFTLLSYKTNNKLSVTERILYYEFHNLGKFYRPYYYNCFHQ